MQEDSFLFRTPGLCLGAITGRRACKRVAGGWQQCAAIGDQVDGFAMFDGAAGETITFLTGGRLTVTSGAAVADGDDVMTDAAGKIITYAAGGGGRFRIGKADAAASVADANFPILHFRSGVAG